MKHVSLMLAGAEIRVLAFYGSFMGFFSTVWLSNTPGSAGGIFY